MSNIEGKVWGKTENILSNSSLEFHRIEVMSGARCSNHCHKHKWNGFFVEKGELEIHVFKSDYDLEDVTILKAGDFTMVKPGEYHFFKCNSDAIAFEIYWAAPLGVDIVRKDVGSNNTENVQPKKERLFIAECE